VTLPLKGEQEFPLLLLPSTSTPPPTDPTPTLLPADEPLLALTSVPGPVILSTIHRIGIDVLPEDEKK